MSWGRMLAMPETAATEATISRNWSWLEKQGLVRTERDRRIRKVYLLMEDGSGRPYARSSGEGRGFFKLPYEYFTQGWHRKLTLAAKVALLVSLAQAPTFTLPKEHASRWYGISADTLQRGIDELQSEDLLKAWMRSKKAPRARFGFTMERHYRLKAPFARTTSELSDLAEVPW